MRTAFIEALCELAAADPRVFLLTADVGFWALEPFAERFPDRFLNVGVAEQNLIGVATGLAREGFVPFAYTIATFISMRGYEQFRNGPVMHRLPVRMVGVGGGFSYGHAGATHHALEDLTIARTHPGITVVAPVDNAQTRTVVRATANLPEAVYLRVDKNPFPDIPTLKGAFAPDTPELIRPGADVLFLSTGSITHEVLKAADLLRGRGVSAAVAVQAHLSFRPGPALVSLLAGYTNVLTVEEGLIAGGLGSLAAETIAQEGLRCRLTRVGVEMPFLQHTGGSAHMLRRHGLDAVSLAGRALAACLRRVAA
jgi:transketolase